MSAMTERDGVLYWRKLPYSGAGFQINPDSSVNAYIIDLGVIKAPYQPICYDNKNPKIDYTMIELPSNYDGEEYFALNGKGFTGIGLCFNNDYCCDELLFIDGLRCGIASWYENTKMAILHPYTTSNYSENYAWTYPGEWDYARFKTEKFSISFYSDQLILLSMTFDFDVKKILDTIKVHTSKFPIQSITDLVNIELRPRIFLTFKKIKDVNNFLEFAYLTGHSHNVETLYIRVEENISQTKLGLLINLEKVFFEGKHSEHELELIQQKYPSIQIQLRS